MNCNNNRKRRVNTSNENNTSFDPNNFTSKMRRNTKQYQSEDSTDDRYIIHKCKKCIDISRCRMSQKLTCNNGAAKRFRLRPPVLLPPNKLLATKVVKKASKLNESHSESSSDSEHEDNNTKGVSWNVLW